MNIRKLNIDDLQRGEEVYNYYQNNYEFSYLTHKDGRFKNIPILKKTSQYFESQSLKIPTEYIEGFMHEYNKPLPIIKTEIDCKWLLKSIQPNPIIFMNDSFELGCKTAEAFKAWEYIICDLPKFENYFMPEIQIENGMKPTSIKLIIALGDLIAGTYYGSIPYPAKNELILKQVKEVFRREFVQDIIFIKSLEDDRDIYTFIAEQVILRAKWLVNQYNINRELYIPENPGLLMHSAIYSIPFKLPVNNELIDIAKHFRNCYEIIKPFLKDLYKEMIQKKGNASFLYLPLEKVATSESKVFPDFKKCFFDYSIFEGYLSIPQVSELYEFKNNKYYWKPKKKVYLAGFAYKILNKNLLIDSIASSQDLAKVFCPFFNIKFNTIYEKQFQPDRAKIDYFKFIK
jgi:hypothetical protein